MLKIRKQCMMVGLECYNGDEASQWKRPKFDPSPSRNPLTNLHKNWRAQLCRTAPNMLNFVAIGAGVPAPQIRDFAVLLG